MRLKNATRFGNLAQEVADLTRRYRKRLGSADAEDLAQQAALRVLERPAPDGRTGPWLERVAANLLVDRWRRRTRADRAIGRSVDPSVALPDERLLAAERRRVVRREALALPRELRRPLLLRYWLAEPYDRAPARIGLVPPTARTRVRRALDHLRARLAALRVWLPSCPVVLKPAMVALFVVASEGPLAPQLALADQAPTMAEPAARKAAPPPTRRIPAAAPAPAGKPPAARAAVTDAPPIQKLVFVDDDVAGFVDSPDGIRVTGESKVPFISLIEIRASFRAELMKTLEDL